MKPLLIMVVLMLSFLSIDGKERKKVYGSQGGIIIDDRSQKPIANVIVKCVQINKADTTDENGRFNFEKIESNFYDFEVNVKGYNTFFLPSIIVKTGVNKDLKIQLEKQSVVKLNKMVVTSSKIANKTPEQTTSVVRLSNAEIENSPGALQDVNEVIKILPSALGSGDDWDNSVFVRGGNEHENVYIIDGIEVSNISHFGSENSSGGAISSFHPGFIDHLDFYAGAFPASAPPRLSSVTEIDFREGSKTDHSFQIDLNMSGCGLFSDGFIIKDKLSYIFNARISFLDIIQTFINTDGMPKYQNGQLKLDYDINKNNKIHLNLLGMHDSYKENDDDEDAIFSEENARLIGGLGWKYISDKWNNKLILSGIYSRGEGWETSKDSKITFKNFKDTRKKYQIKNNSSIFFREKDQLTLGANFEIQDYNEHFSNNDYYFYTDSDGNYQTSKGFPEIGGVFDNDSNFTEKVDASNKDTSFVGYRIGEYISYCLNVGNTKIIAGLRDDYYTILKENALSPRLSSSIDFNRFGTVSVSGGLYYQYPTYISALDMKDQIKKVKLQRNWQTALGYEKQINKYIIIGTEAYYKYYDREPLYEIKDQEIEMDTTFTKDGKKRSYGIEIYAQKKKIDKFYYNISYTLMNSEIQFKNKKWYNSKYNLRNNATIVLGSQFHKNHGFSARFDLSEGYPYTAIDLEASDINVKYDIKNGWNTKRRNFRTKIGLRYDLKWYGKRLNLTGYIEVKNLLNQTDVIHESYDPTGGGKIKQSKGMGILPIGGLTIDF